MSKRYELALIIPCYNEHSIIYNTLDCVDSYFREQCSVIKSVKNYVIVVVDDGSVDNTRFIVKRYIENNRSRNIILIELADNHGKGFAIRHAFAVVDAAHYLVMDCDLSASLSNFPVTYADRHFDLVLGNRHLPESVISKKQSFLRRFYSRVFNLLVKWRFDIPYSDTQAGWKLYSHVARDLIIRKSLIDRYAFDVEHILICVTNGLTVKDTAIEWRDMKPRSWHYRYIREMWSDLKKIKSNRKYVESQGEKR